MSQNSVIEGGLATILVVDDDACVRRTCGRVLRTRGYRVRSASGVADALGMARVGALTPDLLLSDVIMRDGRGPELAHDLCSRFPELPVLLMSATCGPEVLERLPLPRVAFLAKPFTSAELGTAVASLLRMTSLGCPSIR